MTHQDEIVGTATATDYLLWEQTEELQRGAQMEMDGHRGLGQLPWEHQ